MITAFADKLGISLACPRGLPHIAQPPYRGDPGPRPETQVSRHPASR